MTGADLLSDGQQGLRCPHGSEVAKWDASHGPCTTCIHETLLKMTVCHVAGHRRNYNDPGCLAEYDHEGAETRTSSRVYECVRCKALFT